MFIPIALSIIAGIVCGSGFVLVYNKKNESGGKAKAEDLIRKAKNEAADIVLKAKKEAGSIADKSQQEEEARRKDWRQTEKRLSERETSLDNRFDQLEKRSEKLTNKEREIDDLKLEIHQIRDKQQEKLEKIAGLTKLDAKDKLIKMTKKTSRMISSV